MWTECSKPWVTSIWKCQGFLPSWVSLWVFRTNTIILANKVWFFSPVKRNTSSNKKGSIISNFRLDFQRSLDSSVILSWTGVGNCFQESSKAQATLRFVSLVCLIQIFQEASQTFSCRSQNWCLQIASSRLSNNIGTSHINIEEL